MKHVVKLIAKNMSKNKTGAVIFNKTDNNNRKGLAQPGCVAPPRAQNNVRVNKFHPNQAFRAVSRRVAKMIGFTIGFLMVLSQAFPK